MDNFDIISLDDKEFKILVIMKTYESPFDYIDEIETELRKMNFSGSLIMDQLLHSKNTGERFISAFFDGNSFDNSKFRNQHIDKRSYIRSYMCDYIRSILDILTYSSLTVAQQQLIAKGVTI